MNFERFINNINTDDNYKNIVKDILNNNVTALQDTHAYLRADKDLVLFACRYDRLIGEHIDESLKSDKEFLVEFAKHNHTVPYFMNTSLRSDKQFLADLIMANYKSVLLLDIGEITKT